MFSSRALTFAAVTGFLFLAGCASGTYQARMAEREKLTASSGLYCEFVNGEQHPDVDVELNMQMAKRCDASKHFTVTNFKTSSEMNGVIYCCQTLSGRREARREEVRERRSSKRAEPTIESDDDVIPEAPVKVAAPKPAPRPAPKAAAKPAPAPAASEAAPEVKPPAKGTPKPASTDDEVLPD